VAQALSPETAMIKMAFEKWENEIMASSKNPFAQAVATARH
jgi:hypothetical protein